MSIFDDDNDDLDDDRMMSLDDLEPESEGTDDHSDWGDEFDDMDSESWDKQYGDEDEELEGDPWDLN